MNQAVRAHVTVRGRVQGVGFRYETAREARRLGVAGWVRNLESGDVEAVFEGPRRAIEEMIAWTRSGPPGAWVREVQVRWDEPPEGLATFEVRATAFGHA